MDFKNFLEDQLIESVSSDGYIGIGWVYKGKVLGLVETLEDGITFNDTIHPHTNRQNCFTIDILKEFPELGKIHYTSLPRYRVSYNSKNNTYYVLGTPLLIKNTKFQKALIDEYHLHNKNVKFDNLDSEDHYSGDNGPPFDTISDELKYFD